MTNSSTFVSGSDEVLQGFAGIDQVLGWEPLLASKTSPQPNEAFRVIGKPYRSGCVVELGLKECVLPLWYRRDIGTVRYTHTAGANSNVSVPIGSGLEGRFRAWP
jgi:hypothetical protein